MPRGKGQPPAAAQNLPYGQGEAMADAQRAIPLPDNRKPPAQALGPGPAAGAPPGAAAGPPPGMQEALAHAAMAEDPSGSLTDPTTRPNEPITAGVGIGPGPGPEALNAQRAQRASVASFFAIAAETFAGDPQLAAMARRAQQRGL